MKILVCGASFAGLSTAFWMSRLGHAVTLVEVAPALRKGGTAVDIKGNTVAIARRMGIFEAIQANRLALERTEFKTADDVTVHAMVVRAPDEPPSDDELEIERNVLLEILFARLPRDVDVVFDDSVTTLTETADGVDVTFERGAPRTFDLVLGCDGLHSTVRKLWFGSESDFSHFLHVYTSVTIVEKSLVAPNTLQMFNAPGKAAMLNAYRNKTDIVLAFYSDTELAYDRRDEAAQRRIVAERFTDVGWRCAELLREVQGCESFWFDKLSQIRMSAWSKGRVALIGDAAYCASPAAGMGGSLAIDGAAAFAEAMQTHGADFAAAFRAYEAGLRPFVDEVQAQAVEFGVRMLVPRTEEEIRARYEPGRAF